MSASQAQHLEQQEDDRLWNQDTAQFFNLNSFNALMTKPYRTRDPIAPVEPEEHVPEPVVAIQYSAEYRYVMNLVRGVFTSGEVSPRLFIILSFGLKHCPANYALWKRKRDVLLDAALFAQACHGVRRIAPWTWNPHVPPPKESTFVNLLAAERARAWEEYERKVSLLQPYSFAPHLDGKLAGEQDMTAGLDDSLASLTPEEAMQVHWAPAGHVCLPPLEEGRELAPFERLVRAVDYPHLVGDDQDSVGDALRVYDPWHAAAWEFRTSRYTAVVIGKSFQTWNHRKELLMAAAARTSLDVTSTSGAVGSEIPATTYASHRTDRPRLRINFSDFDERVLTRYVLHNEDSKNYHAWSHRAWFVIFTGLLTTPSGLQQELAETESLLLQDLFNNSAWAHRMLSLRHALTAELFPVRPPTVDTRPEEWNAFPPYFPCAWVPNPRLLESADMVLTDDEFTAAFERVLTKLRGELHFALRFAQLEPRNESPFTYAAGLARFVQNILHRRPNQLGVVAGALQLTSEIAARVACVDVDAFARDTWTNFPLASKTFDDEPIDVALYAPGSTEALRRTPVALFRDSTAWTVGSLHLQLCVSAGTMTPAEELQSRTTLKSEALRLAQVDPIRRKFWRREAEYVSMDGASS